MFPILFCLSYCPFSCWICADLVWSHLHKAFTLKSWMTPQNFLCAGTFIFYSKIELLFWVPLEWRARSRPWVRVWSQFFLSHLSRINGSASRTFDSSPILLHNFNKRKAPSWAFKNQKFELRVSRGLSNFIRSIKLMLLVRTEMKLRSESLAIFHSFVLF